MSDRIRALHVMQSEANILALTEMARETRERLDAAPGMEMLTHEECETEAGQLEALKVKVARPNMEYKALDLYYTILLGLRAEQVEIKAIYGRGGDPIEERGKI